LIRWQGVSHAGRVPVAGANVRQTPDIGSRTTFAKNIGSENL